jgi:ATP-dependent Clp protease ATP-binding subunit ClpA
LLQLLDDGRLTDSQGRTVDFKNTIVIMTSNLGNRVLADRESMDLKETERRMMGVLKNFFRPEFLNRVDEIIIFRFLSRDDMIEIVDLMAKRVNERLRDSGLTLELTDSAREYFADEGYDPDFGARPLSRLMQRQLLDPLARMLVDGSVAEGSTVRADRGSEGIVLDIQ